MRQPTPMVTAVGDISPEADRMAAAMRAAFAEVGYPDIGVHPQADGTVEVSPDAPPWVIYREQPWP